MVCADYQLVQGWAHQRSGGGVPKAQQQHQSDRGAGGGYGTDLPMPPIDAHHGGAIVESEPVCPPEHQGVAALVLDAGATGTEGQQAAPRARHHQGGEGDDGENGRKVVTASRRHVSGVAESAVRFRLALDLIGNVGRIEYSTQIIGPIGSVVTEISSTGTLCRGQAKATKLAKLT